MNLSFVIPVYRAEKILPVLIAEIKKNCPDGVSLAQIVLVEDRSPDESWEVIKQLKGNHPEICGLRLSKNFGQHKAILAGLEKASGDWIVVMDCDLQDSPSNIPSFIDAQKSWNCDGVVATRIQRQDNWVKRATSKGFYRVFYWLTGVKQDATVANFGLYSKKVIEGVKRIGANDPFFPFLVNWTGYDLRKVSVQHGKRHSGKSTYTWAKLIKLAAKVIVTNSNKPLYFAIKIGFLFSFISFGMVAYTLFQWYHGNIKVLGFASIMASMWFLAGVTMSLLGVASLYLGKVYENSKNRPPYLIDEEV